MLAKKTCLLLVGLLINFLAISQVETSISDTIVEEIIYEYDTIYLETDTIKLVDTIYIEPDTVRIIDTVFQKPERKYTNKNVKRFFKRHFVVRKPEIVSFEYNTFLGEFNDKMINDSVLSKRTLGQSLAGQFDYPICGLLFSIGLEYSFLNEKQSYQSISLTSSKENSVDGNYDSLAVNNSYNAEYYYRYLGLYLYLGKQWEVNQKLALGFSFGVNSSFLSDYEQGNTSVSKNELKDFILSANTSFKATFMLSKYVGVYFKPFYQYSFFTETKYPSSFTQRLGVGLGLSFFL